MSFRDLPLRRKLIVMIALATGLGLGLNLVMQLTTGLRSSRAAMQAQLIGVAQIVATNSAAALRFDDTQAATATLAGLSAQPEIRHAVLRRPDGRVFANFPLGARVVAEPDAAPGQLRVDGGFWDAWMHIDHPVRQDGANLGSLHLEVDLSAMWHDFFERIALAIATTGAALLIAVALAARLQRSISQPILGLAAVAEAVGADQDYSRRVEATQNDEVGHLARRFNAMLDELQTRNRELKQHHAELERQVDQRTAQLRLAKEQAEAANSAKTHFLANMSHELRTPLNAVIGAAQLMKAGEQDPAHRAHLVDAIQRSGTNLLGLIESILDLARIEAGELTLHRHDFHLIECIDAALATCGLAARAKGLQLACIVAPGLTAWRHGDAARLRQVLLNLLGNAVKFTLAGEIVVQVDPGASADEVCLRITDTGIGIAAAALPKVFEPFRQADEGADRRFGGSGLGLAIVHQLVDAMGGQVQVSSRLGEGSTFTLRLPLPAARHPAPETAAPRREVAFFEPHEPSARALQATLERMGCAVRRCHTAADLTRWCTDTQPPTGRAAPAAAERWLLVATDHPEAADWLAPAGELMDAERVIGMSGVEAYDVDMARELWHLPRSVIKPVTRSALASRFVASFGAHTSHPVPLELMSASELQALTHVLVVEDDHLNQAIVCGLLRHGGYRVSAVGDGRSAISALQREAFDVVLMDWQMPDMDGLEVTRQLRAGIAGPQAQRVPIVALTANAFAEDREACLAAGMDDFLTKPVLAAGLLATIEHWARRHAPQPPAPPQAAHPTEAPRVFDPSVLAALPMVADGSQPAYADEVLALFTAGLPATLAALHQALADGDRRALHRQVHTLKSSAASVGALALADVAGQAEQMLRAGAAWPAELMAQLHIEADRLGLALRQREAGPAPARP
jgi:signal transduction histidine kinase/CheY-like chemotaxis protein/HPt (histidine-containing phosphotransfer) domain-containing protein